MNELEVKKLWQETNDKLEKTLARHQLNTKELFQLKSFHFISSMKPTKFFALFTGFLWVGLGVFILGNMFIYTLPETNKFFLFSASIQVFLTALALIIYLYQLITIYQVDISDPILKTQKRIASLKTSTLWVTRILFLQLPVWTTFWWNTKMFQEWNTFQWVITGSITFVFTFLAVWLFINIKIDNKDKKWFKLIFTGKEWTPLMKAKNLLDQIESYHDEGKENFNQSHQ